MINIEVKNLTVSIKNDSRVILDDIDLYIKEGEIIGLIGLSGSGKSVLGKTLSGIIPNLIPLEVMGSIELFGREVSSFSNIERIETIGYIFQNADNQIVSSTVQGELSFGPENLALHPIEIQERVTEVLDKLSINKYRHYNPEALSGGEKHLLALGAILTVDPAILICDEILCQLDKDGEIRVINILHELRDAGKTILIIEHDTEKLDFVDRIYTLRNKKLYSQDSEGNPAPLEIPEENEPDEVEEEADATDKKGKSKNKDKNKDKEDPKADKKGKAKDKEDEKGKAPAKEDAKADKKGKAPAKEDAKADKKGKAPAKEDAKADKKAPNPKTADKKTKEEGK